MLPPIVTCSQNPLVLSFLPAIVQCEYDTSSSANRWRRFYGIAGTDGGNAADSSFGESV